MKYFISFELVTLYGKTTKNCVIEREVIINSEETLCEMQNILKEWELGDDKGFVTILYFKELS